MKKIAIAVDAMGGDFAPGEVVKGCIIAAQDAPHVDIILLGLHDILKTELEKHVAPDTVKVEAASDVINMDEEPAWAIRNKHQSTIVVGNKMVREGRAQAFVSAGNTGAVVAAAILIMGRIKGISRPGIMVRFPMRNRDVYLIDAGANSECKPENLLEFAIVANSYLSSVIKIENPSVGLLSIGEERSKGNDLIKDTYQLLERAKLNFYGNVEGKDIPLGTTDIVVCDGYTGNIALKLSESLAMEFVTELKALASSSLLAKFGGLLLKSGLEKMRKRIDAEEYGGMLLLGVNGVCVISHGRSSSKAIRNAILQAISAVEGGVVAKINEDLKGKPYLYV
ncbi:MAG: phosphate acyltransferase PlsX [Actinobacteria bacterium]|nr:phosphate acyltransferase PlsX [Actinomycetota bacterium]